MKFEGPTFIRLLNLLSAIRELAPFCELTAEEEQLLGDLVVRWHKEQDLTVSDVMLGSGRASASTIYRRLIGLRDKGLVALSADERDKRIRRVEPTGTAKDYMKLLGHGLETLMDDGKLAG